MAYLNRGACRGFTLVELVLMLTIVGVLAAVAAPRMVDRTAFQDHGAAAEVRTALRYAQKLAMAKNRDVCVTRTPAPSLALSFSLTAGGGGACASPVLRPDGGGNYVVTPPAGITLTSSLAVFRFNPQGQPVSNTGVLLNIVTTLTVGGSVPVTVTRETGYVQ
ncbi:MAG: prepilin-type N-terminal cleavage/methylation domain-containing protein [Thiobacillus sp.]|nr:prepilin-type N-terminal cleavage/methylation domain-containing protein [Thiobacillus sp.]